MSAVKLRETEIVVWLVYLYGNLEMICLSHERAMDVATNLRVSEGLDTTDPDVKIQSGETGNYL